MLGRKAQTQVAQLAISVSPDERGKEDNSQQSDCEIMTKAILTVSCCVALPTLGRSDEGKPELFWTRVEAA